MKRILTTAILAIAVIATPAAARPSQSGQASAITASDSQVAPMRPGRSHLIVQRGKPGTPTSMIVKEPRRNARSVAMAMMSCCPKGVSAPMQGDS